MNIIEILGNLVTQLKDFDNDIVLVTYNKSDNSFTFRQREKTVVCTNLNFIYLPVRRKNHLMMPGYLNYLLTFISDLLSKGKEVLEGLMVTPKKGSTELWTVGSPIDGYYLGPKLLGRIKYFNISNPLLVRFILYFYNQNSRVLYNYIKLKKSDEF